MARHLMIGAAAATGADGGISIEKLSADGPVELVPGNGIGDSDQIRVIRDNGTDRDVVSPWIKGRNIISYTGKSYEAPVAAQATDTISGTSAAKGNLILKFVRTDGPAPEFFSFNTTIGTTADPTITAANTDALIKTAYEDATLPDWLNKECDATAGSTVVFSGAKRGDTAQSGNTWEYGPVNFELIVESYDGGTQTHTASKTTEPDPGSGDGFLVEQMEKDLQGVALGYYNRVQLPKAPTVEAATGTIYDMYSIVATKDGSTTSAINGVDNLIEIIIASPAHATAGVPHAQGAVIEDKLNPYLASAGFNPVNL